MVQKESGTPAAHRTTGIKNFKAPSATPGAMFAGDHGSSAGMLNGADIVTCNGDGWHLSVAL
jgi:hypothetical protein